MIFPIIFFILGLLFLAFNKHIVQLEAKLKNKYFSKQVDARLAKTQIYIAGGFLIFIGAFTFFLTK